ncbi:MAG TPA: histidine phosphatase family protein [Clostridiales bacterium]|nr:histidine phosphatase family protein [Clostridiales bacterium]
MIYLVRHGKSEANIQKRYCGITDAELSQKGIEQAIQAGRNLKSEWIANIYSSPLKRAADTAKFICRENNIDESKIITEDCLREVNFGVFENMTWDEVRAGYREETDKWILEKHRYKFPEGEGYDDIIKRISHFIDNVPDKSAIVTHFGVIQSVLLYLNIADDTNLWDFIISNCDILVLNDKKFERIIRCSCSYE